MKTTKTLIALGVSCTLGVGAAAFAASTPYPVSIDDATPSASHQNRNNSMITWDTHASQGIGSTSMSAGGSVSSLSGDEMQLSSTTADDDTLALADEGIDSDTVALADEGIYSDFYRVSVVPVMVEQWDYYVLSPAGDDFVVGAADSEDMYVLSAADSEDFYVLNPVSYDVIALFPDSSFESESDQTFAM